MARCKALADTLTARQITSARLAVAVQPDIQTEQCSKCARHRRGTTKRMSRAAVALQSAGWSRYAETPSGTQEALGATGGVVAAALSLMWALLIAKVFTLDAYTGVQCLSLLSVTIALGLKGVGRLAEGRRSGGGLCGKGVSAASSAPKDTKKAR